MHWALDVCFREDASRVRDGHAHENLAVLRHLALDRLRSDNTKIGKKRLCAGWEDAYVDTLLFEPPELATKTKASASPNIRDG